VVLADDHQVVRRGVRLLLEREREVEVVAEAGDLFTAVRHVNGHLPHVLLLDLQMPDGSSLGLIRRLRAQSPDTEIILLTMEDSAAFAREAFAVGAAGYVLKENADEELPLAVRAASRGERYISPRVAARVDASQRAVDGDGLSPRETDVLSLIALGLTSDEISEKLCLSRRTIESHRQRIQRKLGLGRRSELVRYALGHNLIGNWPAPPA
jgi:two-component system, NarL family, response regulator NreC